MSALFAELLHLRCVNAVSWGAKGLGSVDLQLDLGPASPHARFLVCASAFPAGKGGAGTVKLPAIKDKSNGSSGNLQQGWDGPGKLSFKLWCMGFMQRSVSVQGTWEAKRRTQHVLKVFQHISSNLHCNISSSNIAGMGGLGVGIPTSNLSGGGAYSPQPPIVSMDPIQKPGTLPPITSPLAQQNLVGVHSWQMGFCGMHASS